MAAADLSNIDGIVAAYKGIRERWQDAGGELGKRLLVYVAADVDGVCAAKIFMKVLAGDRVKFDFQPVKTDADLSDKLKQLDPEEITTVVCINCGGGLPLADMVASNERHEVHVIDSHRPIHFSIADGSKENIKVWELGDVRRHLQRIGAVAPARKRRRLGRESESGEGSDDSDSEVERTGVSDRRRQRAERRYYRGWWNALPSAVLLEQVARAVMADPPDDFVFFAATAAAEALLSQRLPRQDYDVLAADYAARAHQRNLKKPKHAAGQSYAAFHDVRLEDSIECRLFMLRHWTLWDALWHSPTVAASMRLYSDNHARSELRCLLAGKLGLLEEDYSQTWGTGHGVGSHTERDQEEILLELGRQLRRPPWRIADFTFRCLVRVKRYQKGLSAADMASIVRAVLGRPLPAARGTDEVATPHWTDNFWAANAALEQDQGDSFVNDAKVLQDAIARQAANLLRGDGIRSLSSSFSYAELSEASADSALFRCPLALSELGRTVRDCLRASARTRKEEKKAAAPLLLFSLGEQEHTMVVVEGEDTAPTQEHPDRFGHTVGQAATKFALELSSADFREGKCFRVPADGRNYLIDGLAVECYGGKEGGGTTAAMP